MSNAQQTSGNPTPDQAPKPSVPGEVKPAPQQNQGDGKSDKSEQQK